MYTTVVTLTQEHKLPRGPNCVTETGCSHLPLLMNINRSIECCPGTILIRALCHSHLILATNLGCFIIPILQMSHPELRG